MSVFSTAGSAAFEATPGPRATTPGDADALAEAEALGLALVLGEALAEDCALAVAEALAATVGAGGCVVLC